jgi:arabinose-5-phosphate isomerase
VPKEACLNNQAPTTSTTAALAMGDAVAVLYEHLVDLSKEKFAINHPGGLLGKTLRIKVKDIMVSASDCPKSSTNCTLKEALIEMTSRPLGGLAIVNGEKFMGVIVEGDIRRTLTQNPKGLDVLLKDVMNANPIHIGPKSLASDALELMENRDRPLNILPVLENENFVGFIRLHDLIKEGFSRS